MATVKKSFLSNLFGRDNYDTFKDYAKVIVPIGTGILTILFTLTFFVHWKFISNLLNLVTGTSLLFVAYVGVIILLLDFEVDVEEPERSYYAEKSEKVERTIEYKLTIVWGILLLILGVAAIHFSNKYRKHYSFECSTFLVDKKAGIYHLDCDCEYAAEADNLVRMKGYEIESETNCTLCRACEDWAEDIESDFSLDRYSRR